MVKTLRSILVLAVALILAGCGGSGSPAASTSSSTSSAATGDEATAIQALASTFASGGGGDFGLTQDQSQCVAQGFVDQFGVQGLIDMGVLDSNLAPATNGPSPTMTADQASTAADAMMSCVNSADFISGLMTGTGMDQTVIDCVSTQLGDQGVHDVLVAVFSNDQTKLQTALTPVMMSCALGPSSSS